MVEIISNSKSVVFTGHSIGGAVASLSALWFLSHLQSISYPFTVICITYGSPMLGNESFSRAILQERWGGNFFHVVAQHDIVPRLLFAPSAPIIPHLSSLFSFWQLSMNPYYNQFSAQISEEEKTQLFHIVLKSLEEALKSIGVENSEQNLFWPFGNYIFCSNEGSICLENAVAIIKLLFLMLFKGSPSSSINDHLNYENYVNRIYRQILSARRFIDGNVPESSYDAGITLALQASNISSTVSHYAIKGLIPPTYITYSLRIKIKLLDEIFQ